MKKRLIELLACPMDRSVLELYEREKVSDDIVEGFLVCRKCGHWYYIREGIPELIPPILPKPHDSKFFFEMIRYDEIVNKGPDKYEGLKETHPALRMKRIRDIIVKTKARRMLDIGPGFGQLERMLEKKEVVGLDISKKVLLYNKGVLSGVQGVCEQMPFNDGSFPVVVTLATFQSIVDQRLLLKEIARILKNGGLLVLTISYRWNYPRKPQVFHVKEYEKLKKYLADILHVEPQVKILRYATNSFVDKLDDGDELILTGEKFT